MNRQKKGCVRGFWCIFLFVFLLIVSGCTYMQDVGVRSYSSEFTEMLHSHTRSFKLYRDFETVALCKATYFDRKLAMSFVDSYSKQAHLPDAEKEKLKEEWKNRTENFDEFWVAFYTGDEDINNLASSHPFWNVHAIYGKMIEKPLEIEEIEINRMTNQWMYLIDANRWSKNYIIRFRKIPHTGKVTLVIASMLGTINMEFIKGVRSNG